MASYFTERVNYNEMLLDVNLFFYVGLCFCENCVL